MKPLKLKEIMTTSLLVVDSQDHLIEVAEKMYKENAGSVLVKEEGVISAILTERDIIYNTLSGSLNIFNTLVSALMSKPLVKIDQEETVGRACDVMKEHVIKKLVVTAGSDDIVGIVTMTDIINNYQKFIG